MKMFGYVLSILVPLGLAFLAQRLGASTAAAIVTFILAGLAIAARFLTNKPAVEAYIQLLEQALEQAAPQQAAQLKGKKP